MPIWDVSDLLFYLRSDRFDPLESIDMELLIQKLGILLFLATGRRLGEIANFTSEISNESDRIIFHWPVAFLTKNERKSFTSSLPSISHLQDEDKNLCPVRILHVYLSRRGTFGGDESCLWPISQAALSNMIIKAIKQSIMMSGKEIPSKVGCYQLRKLAASISFNQFSCRNKEKLLPIRMGSKSMSVLKKSYIRFLPKVKYSCVFPLGTLIP